MKYIVTKEIKSETQVFWIFYLQDFMFLVLWAVLTLMLKGKVHSTLQIPYVLFSFMVGGRLMLRSQVNPKRRYYQSIALYMQQPKHIFRYFKEDGDAKKERDTNKTHQRRNTYHRV